MGSIRHCWAARRSLSRLGPPGSLARCLHISALHWWGPMPYCEASPGRWRHIVAREGTESTHGQPLQHTGLCHPRNVFDQEFMQRGKQAQGL